MAIPINRTPGLYSSRPASRPRFGNRHVTSDRSLSMGKETVLSVRSSSSLQLNGTTVEGPVSASSSMQLNGAGIQGSVNGQSSVTVSDGTRIGGSAQSSGSMTLTGAT